jgi:hypothetical protein
MKTSEFYIIISTVWVSSSVILATLHNLIGALVFVAMGSVYMFFGFICDRAEKKLDETPEDVLKKI